MTSMANPTREVAQPCCQPWQDAHEAGTDHEGYEPLIWYDGGNAYIGDGLPMVRFCPWCGAGK